jgi:hypothetical protein
VEAIFRAIENLSFDSFITAAILSGSSSFGPNSHFLKSVLTFGFIWDFEFYFLQESMITLMVRFKRTCFILA